MIQDLKRFADAFTGQASSRPSSPGTPPKPMSKTPILPTST